MILISTVGTSSPLIIACTRSTVSPLSSSTLRLEPAAYLLAELQKMDCFARHGAIGPKTGPSKGEPQLSKELTKLTILQSLLVAHRRVHLRPLHRVLNSPSVQILVDIPPQRIWLARLIFARTPLVLSSIVMSASTMTNIAQTVPGTPKKTASSVLSMTHTARIVSMIAHQSVICH